MFLFLLLFFPLFIRYTFSAPCNASTEFTCNDGGCIPLEWRCDNVADCSDRSDEAECNYFHQCSPGMMMCRDGSCISKHFKCNGEADCLDGHEEHHCEYALSNISDIISDIPEPCLYPKYQCKTGGQCLMEEAVCDGIQDCPDGDDEANCRKDAFSNSTVFICPQNFLKCANDDGCVPSSWVCDGSIDCYDRSDEKDCDTYVKPIEKLCGLEEYQCLYTLECIPLNQTCDGTENCEFGNDEHIKYCPACKEKKCGYKCRITHSGTECYCPRGSKLEENGLTCGPIDYCQREKDGKQCQHFCNSTITGYRCFCAFGYTLQDNRHTCRTDIGGQLLVVLGSTIRTTPLVDPQHSTNGYEQLMDTKGTLRFIDYNYHNDMLFVSKSEGAFSPHYGDLAVIVNKTETTLRSSTGIEHIAIDYIGRNIYYTVKYPSKIPGIYVCTFDGLFCKRIIKGMPGEAQRQIYRGLALHPSSGKMYWLEYLHHQHKIKSSDMDGSNVEILIDDKLEEPQGLTLDPITDNLYFADFSQPWIEKFNLRTRERHIVVSRGVHHPFDLKYFDGYLYWADWGSASLKMVDTTNKSAIATTVHSFRQFPMGIAVNHTAYRVLPSVNPCDKLAEICPWICVPVPGPEPGSLVGKCICPTNYEESNETICFPRLVSNDTDEQSSRLDKNYLKKVCSTGKACLNGGHCLELPKSTTARHLNCSCHAPYIGERCELVDQRTSWSGFWTFCAVLVILTTGFGVLYYRNERIQIITMETIAHLRNRNFPEWWPILNETAAEEEVPAHGPRSFSNPFSSM